MSRVLLDSHAFLWFVANDAALSDGARGAIESADEVMGRKQPLLAVPLTLEETQPLAHGRPITSAGGWTTVTRESGAQLAELGELLKASYASVRASHPT